MKKTPNTRCTFLITLAAGGAVITSTTQAQAQAKLSEKDPQAVAMGNF
jgi:pantothenate kinase